MNATDFMVTWAPIIVLIVVFFWFFGFARRNSRKMWQRALDSNDEIVRELKEIKTLLQEKK